MPDINLFWKKVREFVNSLQPSQSVFYVTSKEDDTQYRKGGVTVEVPRELAGFLVAGNSHRLATDEEIDAFKAAQQEHQVQVKMAKLQTENQKAIEMFEALNRISQVNSTAAVDLAAKKLSKPTKASE